MPFNGLIFFMLGLISCQSGSKFLEEQNQARIQEIEKIEKEQGGYVLPEDFEAIQLEEKNQAEKSADEEEKKL